MRRAIIILIFLIAVMFPLLSYADTIGNIFANIFQQIINVAVGFVQQYFTYPSSNILSNGTATTLINNPINSANQNFFVNSTLDGFNNFNNLTPIINPIISEPISAINDTPILNNGLSLSSLTFGDRLGQLFVLDQLFKGNSNGILSSGPGVTLGDIFILNQLFK